jgi:programmed cell death protein 5
MEDINELKQKKLEELKQYYEAQKELMRKLEAEKQINILLRKLLTQKARERLKNVRLVNQDLYYKAVQNIVALAQAGRFKERLSEDQVKKLLLMLSERKETRIIRK